VGALARAGALLAESPQTPVRQVARRLGPTAGKPETSTAQRKRKLESPTGQELLTRRGATAEPVLGNLRHTKRLSRFTLRGREKVAGHWQRYGLGHHIEEVAPLGEAS
jgi:Transposase DDE domain